GNGLYAVFEHHGTADSFGRTAEYIFGHWLPESPYQLAPREFFEVLGPGYRPDDPEAVEDVWIPIREGR
ncbi:MAG TPA: GyrI-like domain-containing protein, partial [Longimicrobiales bacterium]|nr:GyrI-like domain-containing protein [Longimicrobiales bacterium]